LYIYNNINYKQDLLQLLFLYAVYNGLNEDLDESKILLGNIIDKLEQVINYTTCYVPKGLVVALITG